jgi:hypothetical protein
MVLHQSRRIGVVWKRIEHLKSLDSFTSVTDLEVEDNDDLVRIDIFPVLQKLSITGCPKLKVVGGYARTH